MPARVQVGLEGSTIVCCVCSQRLNLLLHYFDLMRSPSEAELSGGMGPLSATDAYHKSWTTVYEEGFGASLGCAKAYWKQHFVDEDIKTEKERTKSQKMKMWRTPDNQVRHDAHPCRWSPSSHIARCREYCPRK
jgi:hypothetical protein